MIIGWYILNNPKMLTDPKIEIRTSPFKIIDIAIMINFTLADDFEF